MVLTLAAALVAVFLTAGTKYFAGRRPDYRHVRHTISELGERGAHDARLVGLALFLPVGLVCAIISWQTKSEGALGDALSLLSLALAVGYLTAVVFPCDAGSPLSGSWRQGLHNVGGGVEYVAGAIALWRIGQAAATRETSRALTAAFGVAAVVVVLVAVALSVTGLSRWRGGIQRVAETALFCGLTVAALLLETGDAPRPAV